MLIDQLEGIPIARDDGDLGALRDRLSGQRRDDVVGLEALDLEGWDAEGREQFLDEGDLPLELHRTR